MKSSRFIFIFIGLSILIHFSLILIAFKPVNKPAIPEPWKLIPVSLALRQSVKPPASPETATEAPSVKALPPEAPEPITRVEPEITEELPPAAVQAGPEAPNPAYGGDAQSPDPASGEISASVSSGETDTNTASQEDANTVNPFEGLIERINRNKKSTYPLSARKKGYQGTVYILLVLDKDGKMVSSEIIQKSPYSILNSAALKLIDKIMETPYPHNLGKTVSLRLPVTYKLD